MTTPGNHFDALLGTTARDALQSALWGLAAPLTLPQADRLRAHALAIGPAPQPLRLGIALKRQQLDEFHRCR